MAQLKDLLVNGDAKFLADVILDHDPTANLHAATKQYVDSQVGTGTDEKVKITDVTSGSTYLPILALTTDSTNTTTRQADISAKAFKYILTPGTSGGTSKGTAELILGNGTGEGYANSAAGRLTIYGNSYYSVTLKYQAAYTGQTLLIPSPTDGSQTNYLVSKIGSSATGSTTQPVYVDAAGHAQTCSLTASSVGAAASTHSHVSTDITRNTTDATIATGDKLGVFSTTDNKLRSMPSTVAFDTGVSNLWLCKNGTWSAPSGLAPGSHTHGDLNNSGIVTTNPGVPIADGDAILIADASLGNALKMSAITFDGSTTTQFLSKKGSWAKPFASQIYMGWCDTARATAAKTITLDSSFELVENTMIMIRFANGNSAATPTLNINSLGAKNITFNSQSLNNSVLPSAMAPNTYLILQYTGSSWTVMSGYNNYVLMSPYMYNVDRVTSLNRSYSQPIVEYLLATSSTTTGKTPIDAHVLSLNWDNGSVYAAQLAVANGSSTVATPGRIFSRGQLGTAATWSDWLEVPRLSGALTNNQIVVSDESTGTALLKGGPTIGTGTTKFLREDGTWQVPSSSGTVTGSGMAGYLAQWGGTSGQTSTELTVGPVFTSGTTKFLREDGTWQVPSGGGDAVARIFKGTCDTPAATVAKVVVCPEFLESDLVKGAVIFVNFKYTNSGAVGSITLNVNSTGAKKIQYLNNTSVGNIPGTGYIIANMTYQFIYNGTYWVMDIPYNPNDNAYVIRNYYRNRHAGAQAVSPYKIMLVDGGGHYIPYTTATGQTNYEKAPNTTPFNPFASIYIHYANSTISANSKPTDNQVWYMYSYGYPDLRYSFNLNNEGTAGTTALTANKPVYIRAKYNFATGMATLAPGTSSSNYLEASAIVQDLPTSNPNSGDDFYIYIFMGYAQDTYRATIELFNEVYAWNSMQNATTPFQGAPFNGSGTFTAYYGTNSATWTYVKQGRLVTVQGTIPNGTSAAASSITGLPFAASGNQKIIAAASHSSYLIHSFVISLSDGGTSFTPLTMLYSTTGGTSHTAMNSTTMIFYTCGNNETTVNFTYVTNY